MEKLNLDEARLVVAISIKKKLFISIRLFH